MEANKGSKKIVRKKNEKYRKMKELLLLVIGVVVMTFIYYVYAPIDNHPLPTNTIPQNDTFSCVKCGQQNIIYHYQKPTYGN